MAACLDLADHPHVDSKYQLISILYLGKRCWSRCNVNVKSIRTKNFVYLSVFINIFLSNHKCSSCHLQYTLSAAWWKGGSDATGCAPPLMGGEAAASGAICGGYYRCASSLSLVLVLLVQISRGAGHFLLQLIYRRLLFFFFPCANQGALGHDDVREVVRETNSRVASDFSVLRGHKCLGGLKAKVFYGWKVLYLILFCQFLELTVFVQAVLRMSACLQLINPFLGCFYIFFHVSLVIQHMQVQLPMFPTSVECFPSNDGWVGDFSASQLTLSHVSLSSITFSSKSFLPVNSFQGVEPHLPPSFHNVLAVITCFCFAWVGTGIRTCEKIAIKRNICIS